MSHAMQVFRSATASLSSRAAVRSSAGRHRAVMGARYYSEDKASSEDVSKEEKEEKEENSYGEVEGKLKAAEDEVVDLTGRLRYLHADFLNLQRNAAREKEQTRDFAISRFAGDLLETVDVLGFALKSVPEFALKSDSSSSSSDSSNSTSSDASVSSPSDTKSALQYLKELHEGVEMTHRLLLQTLFKYHVKPFDPTGDKFNPNLHEALYQAPIPGKEPGTIVDTQKTGYMIKDRLLRAAQVGVVQDSS